MHTIQMWFGDGEISCPFVVTCWSVGIDRHVESHFEAASPLSETRWICCLRIFNLESACMTDHLTRNSKNCNYSRPLHRNAGLPLHACRRAQQFAAWARRHSCLPIQEHVPSACMRPAFGWWRGYIRRGAFGIVGSPSLVGIGIVFFCGLFKFSRLPALLHIRNV
jgi:hypothetical protein